MPRSKPVTIETRRSKRARWAHVEKQAAKLWCQVWGGRLIPAPRFEHFDFWWCDGRVVIGALEVKDYSDWQNWGEVEGGSPYVGVSIGKYLSAVALEPQEISSFLIVSLPKEVLWTNLLQVDLVRLGSNRDPVTGKPRPVPTIWALYRKEKFHLLSGQPLFDARRRGGANYVVPH